MNWYEASSHPLSSRGEGAQVHVSWLVSEQSRVSSLCSLWALFHRSPSNETAQAENDILQRDYLDTMSKITAWRANKKLPQPVCPRTGKPLTKISPPVLMKKHFRCHCSQLRFNWCTGDKCPNDCRGYEKGNALSASVLAPCI